MATPTPDYQTLLAGEDGRDILALRQTGENPMSDFVLRVAAVDPYTGRVSEIRGMENAATGLARAEALADIYRQRQQSTLAPIDGLPEDIIARYANHGGLRELFAAADQYGQWANQAASAAAAQERRIVHTAGIHEGENPNQRLPNNSGRGGPELI